MTRIPFDDTDRLCVNTIRALAIDMVEAARSGHPGLPMGAAPMAYVLWQRYLRFAPQDPLWPDRDRFVLSAGHGSALIYALLHAYGFDLPEAELRAFRQWGSKTPGHPEAGHTAGVEATTGPLGQGSAIAVGMAIAERALAHRFSNGGDPLVDHTTYAIVSDGDIMEGISGEAASLAGHLGLGKLVYLYDSNLVSLDGPTSLAFSEDVGARYRAYGWHVVEVADGDSDLEAIDAAIAQARAQRDRPSLIVVRTTIGFGSPKKAGSSGAHGSPLGTEEAAAAKRAYGLDPESSFAIPPAARARFAEAGARGSREREQWRARFEQAAAREPALASAWAEAHAGTLPTGWDADLPAWEPGASIATRVAGGKVLNALAGRVATLFGGDADLSVSTKTALGGTGDFDGRTGAGRNVHFGVREHAMGAIANGIAYHGGLRPFVSTFLAFSDYMRTPVRLAALDRLRVVYVWTHDSLGVGEDGPTHQPVEHVTALRVIPGLSVIRPGDANECAAAWAFALENAHGPVALILSRQDLPVLPGTREHAREGVARGAYVLAETTLGSPRVILIATGSELALAWEAHAELERRGIAARLVSMPCRETFDAQDAAYRGAVLPAHVKARVAVEAGVSLGWERYVGDNGRVLGVDRFGASAPGEIVFEHYGFTVAEVVRLALASLEGE